MTRDIGTVLASVVEVLVLVGAAWIYARRLRPDLDGTLRLAMHIFTPCLIFTAILDSQLPAGDVAKAMAATLIQIGSGLILGWCALSLLGWKTKRELLLPIAFVNSANLPFPLLLANFGPEGLSLGVVSFTVTTTVLFTLGVLLLHGKNRIRDAFREPALWAAVAAGILRILNLKPPDALLMAPRLAGMAAVPLMLVLFGESLSRARMTAMRDSVAVTVVRFLSGAAALMITLLVLRPEGLLRGVLILYAFLPPAMVNVIVTRKAGRDDRMVASAVLLATLAAIPLLPLLLALGR